MRTPDAALSVLGYPGVYSFGGDAVMATGDAAVTLSEDTRLAAAPCAGRDIAGARVAAEGGPTANSAPFVRKTPWLFS